MLVPYENAAEEVFVWLSGNTKKWDDATTHISSHSLHLGSGVFEAMRCYETDAGPAVFRMDAHLDRIFASAAIYQMAIPFKPEELEDAVCQTIRRNRLLNCYVRLIAFYGPGTLGILPQKCAVEVAIIAMPFQPYSESHESVSVRTFVSSWTKFHFRMIPTTGKACGQYVNSMLALREAVDNGYDEALLLNSDGDVAEGSGQNIFVVHDDCLITNDESASILPGITRDSVLQIARGLGYNIQVRTLRLEDLFSAQEAFFTGTAVEIAPISQINETSLNGGQPGPITVAIQRAFHAVVSGHDPRYQGWLRYVKSEVS